MVSVSNFVVVLIGLSSFLTEYAITTSTGWGVVALGIRIGGRIVGWGVCCIFIAKDVVGACSLVGLAALVSEEIRFILWIILILKHAIYSNITLGRLSPHVAATLTHLNVT